MAFKPNRSVTFQIWVIGSLVPVAFMLTGEAGIYDFAAFWVAARQTLSGEGLAIYDPAATHYYADLLQLGGATIFPYPPHAILFFLPFALLPYIPAYLAWNVVTGAFFLWAARPYLPRGFPLILPVLTPAALLCLDFGQTGLLLGALWLLAFRGKWAAVALLTFKPHLGLLSILSLTSWRAFIYTVALTLALIAVSVLLFGPAIWLTFFEHSLGHAAKIADFKRWYFAGVTPAIGYGLWGWLGFGAVGALLLVQRVNVFTAATASFLISPYGFHYDMVVVCMGLGLLIYSHWGDMPIRHRIPVALGFLAPVIAVSGTWWMPPIIACALWVQTKYDVTAPRPEHSARLSRETSSD